MRPHGVHVADYVKHADDDTELMGALLALATIIEGEYEGETHASEANDDRAIDTFHNRNIPCKEGLSISFEDPEKTTGSGSVSGSTDAARENINIDNIFIVGGYDKQRSQTVRESHPRKM